MAMAWVSRRQRYLVCVAVGCLIVVVCVGLYFRSRQLSDVLVNWTDRIGPNKSVEFRMDDPFVVHFRHSLAEMQSSAGPEPQSRPSATARPGIAVGPEIRDGRVVQCKSEYDWLRGEHYVEIELQIGDWFLLVNQNCTVPIRLWNPEGRVSDVKVGRTYSVGEGIGKQFVTISKTGSEEESLWFRADRLR